MPEQSVYALFSARLKEARKSRGLSQRALGDRMGLGKEKGSARVNRYERQASAISFKGLEQLATALSVPPAFLIADNAVVAQVILELASSDEREQERALAIIKSLMSRSDLADALAGLADQPLERQEQLVAKLLDVLKSD